MNDRLRATLFVARVLFILAAIAFALRAERSMTKVDALVAADGRRDSATTALAVAVNRSTVLIDSLRVGQMEMKWEVMELRGEINRRR